MSTIEIKKFDEFIEKCVIGKKAILTTPISNNNDEKLFSKDNLEKVQAFLKEVKVLFDIKNTEARKKNKENRNSKEKTWGIGDVFSGYVFQELIKKEEWIQEVIIKILLHCNWLMYLCSERQHKQDTGNNKYYKEDNGFKSYFETETYWSIGQAFSGTSLDAMLFIVELMLALISADNNEESNSDAVLADAEKANKVNEIRQRIIAQCNDLTWKNGLKWNEKDNKPISSNSISNVLLFLCKPDYYLPIPAQNKKELISEKLADLADIMDGSSCVDQALYEIREKIRQIKDDSDKLKYPYLNPFWHPDIRPFWDNSTSDLTSKELSDEVLLEYKKAMVLYGPPGTSKSYQARRMAENIIAKELRKKNKDIKTCLETISDVLNIHIHKLQLHPNYTYDDFIVGKTIASNRVETKRGFMLNLIDNIGEGDSLPHIIILDEINRVDISRVFGELFTAMEPSYRKDGEGVKLSILDENAKDMFLKVPENMYFIGTMNMIDFSLEQVDFALRRRFLWRLSTYDEKRLEDILSEKTEDEINEIHKRTEEDQEQKVIVELTRKMELWEKRPDNFVDCCTKLNKIIEWESNLGKDYLIGHAFFAEIVDIFKQVYDWEKAKNILWQISILPTIEAYCGTMDANSKESFIGKCNDAFFPKPKQDKNIKKEQPELTAE